jgi:redox-sensitive bicupin YhaK (pirin superfamily)
VKAATIPEVAVEGGARVRVICGRAGGAEGPVRDIVTDPEYLDVAVPPNAAFAHPTKPGHTAFAYVIDGKGVFAPGVDPSTDGTLVHWDDGDRVEVTTGRTPVRFLFVSGRPLREPVAWYGPIVMNTEEELRTAFEEFKKGTFIK